MGRPTTFFLKLFLLLLPLGAIVVGYITSDPFKVLYLYEDYYADQVIVPNRDVVSTEVLLRNLAERKYDSFIFGSSRSLAFQCRDWAPHIGSHATFHFDAFDESLFGVAGKVRLLHERGATIRNALLIFDGPILERTTDRHELLFIKHPLVSKGSKLRFHFEFFKAYFSDFSTILYYKVFASDPFWPQSVLVHTRVEVTRSTNDVVVWRQDAELDKEGENYYQRRSSIFSPRDMTRQIVADPVIGPEQLRLLNDVQHVFKMHGTSCRVIISPNYDQKQLNPADLEALATIFGSSCVFDYSGINRFTADIHNYYETSHFRPFVAREILSIVYGKSHAPLPASISLP